jgi:hypothetical protein
MATERIYTVNISVLLKPIQSPHGRIGIGNEIVDFTLLNESWFDFRYSGSKDSKLTLQIEHHGKPNKDHDTAIIIEQIKFNNITSPRFAWAGSYRPSYPPHYKQDQVLAEILSPHTYLGWNGIWALDFTLPIYTWIHKIEDLGWIYD